MEEKNFELIPQIGVHDLKRNKLLNLGDNIGNIILSMGSPSLIRKSELIYPDSMEELQNTYYDNPFVIICSAKDSVYMLEFGIGDKFYFEEINLTKIKYTDTIKELAYKGYEYDRFTESVYQYDTLGFFIYLDGEGNMETAGMYAKDHFTARALLEEKYEIKTMKRDKSITRFYYKYKDK
ncbi:hypothetical protein Dip518_001573 [Parelusimicrobium proximum]|uniref:hypothetical protein n=1 Tax=Parelusimicrobium proximum TaxID=3228953 RepID=UPI003D17157D